MTDDQARTNGKAQARITKVARTVTQPAGKDIDWERVRAVGAIIGAIAVIHGLKNRSWRYAHSAAAGAGNRRRGREPYQEQICRGTASAREQARLKSGVPFPS